MALIVDIEKKLGSFRLQVSFETRDGVLALLGASGCGKSMTLKCIAGIERPDRGRIELDGRVLFDSQKHIDLPPQERRVGYLFQQYALFPNMTVEQNIACGIRDKARRKERTAALITQMHLTGLEKHLPRQLSGGQQQRTVLARILGNEPELLLLDEPFSALDSHLRFTLEQEVRSIIRGFGRPVILVSHDRDEAYRFAENIAVLRGGHMDVIGSREAVFADPLTRSGAILTGCKNLSPITWIDENHVLAEAWGIRLQVSRHDPACGWIGVRMHDVHPDGQENRIICEKIYEIENPFSRVIMLRAEGAPDTGLIGMEISKAVCCADAAGKYPVSIPVKSILLLRE